MNNDYLNSSYGDTAEWICEVTGYDCTGFTKEQMDEVDNA